MNEKTIVKTELNKILSVCSTYAVLDDTKTAIENLKPITDLTEAKKNLIFTKEATTILFEYGGGKVEYFPCLLDEIERSKKGATLSCEELLSMASLLRSIRIVFNSITTVSQISGVQIPNFVRLSENLKFDQILEDDITTKILNDSEVSDFASDKLYSIRKEIKLLNEKIRVKLSEYLTGDDAKYLQDGIVTMRDNRYVLPVKAEYKRNIKGFIHDRSRAGATFFIEPEDVLEMNNELRSLTIDEKEEVERILGELSRRLGFMADELVLDTEILSLIDGYYARAEYGYKHNCIMPELNCSGVISIDHGRHPLIDPKKVVPVSVSLGKNYRFLLISGPNTGGKTVTLKMIGLFAMMAMCGIFVPCEQANLSVFEEIYCDLGDSQSIEESLSTFSSHVQNIIEIVNNANDRSLVLIDELGGGTDPDEGQALAKSVVKYLLNKGCSGVVTTHYTSLKEFAYSAEGIENACMEFDADTLRPLYRIKIGLSGSSNALLISRRLGLNEEILADALQNLSKDAQRFEYIVRSAEESRIKAEEILQENKSLQAELNDKIRVIDEEKEKLQKEKEKLFLTSKAEARRIINERTSEAEELLDGIKEIFDKQTITESDLIKARTLKNKLVNAQYSSENEEITPLKYEQASEKNIVVGARVFVRSVNAEGQILSVRKEKKEAEVLYGNAKIRVKFSDLSVLVQREIAQPKLKKQFSKKDNVQVSKNVSSRISAQLELNVIGQTVLDALCEVEKFLDNAVLSNVEEVRIVHGVGTGKLRKGIHEYLKKSRCVSEFRLGQYGEGETGVTIVKIK